MQVNWSLILNVLLLIGVVVAIGRLMVVRRQSLKLTRQQPPSLGPTPSHHFDDIIAVRKVNDNLQGDLYGVDNITIKATPHDDSTISVDSTVKKEQSLPKEANHSLMMFLLAKESRQLAGYELLQTVLAAGLRFGEGNLFHRHQYPNGQGPVLCSLAAATTSGAFDLQNIGAFRVRGLCLFMQASGNPTIDSERFTIMLETAKQLSEGLDTYLLDDKRRPFSAESLARYRGLLNISEVNELAAVG